MEWLFRHPWSRPMPRIEDRLLKSVIYLYKSREDAESGAPGGSGFLVGEQCAIPEAVFLFAVTNAHVARSCPVMRTAGRAADKRVIVRKESDWYRHPDQDDVVVTPIGFAPKDARDFYLDYVPREWFVTPENFSRAIHDVNDIPPGNEAHAPLGYEWEHQPLGWPFGPGEEVVMAASSATTERTRTNHLPVSGIWQWRLPCQLTIRGASRSRVFLSNVGPYPDLAALPSSSIGSRPRLLLDW